jgi:hypothetical protein
MRHEAILTHRVLGGSAEPSDWEDLELKAQKDPEIWHRLALALRDENELGLAVGSTAAAAEAVELRDLSQEHEFRGSRGSSRRGRSRFAPWIGWAAAAGLALLWLTGVPGSPRTSTPPAQAETMQQALNLYRQVGTREGRFVKELPLLMVARRPAEKGQGTEVVYVRRLLEKRRVRDFYEPATDEWGNPVAVPVSDRPDDHKGL